MFSCKDCRGEADKKTHTVKIDLESILKVEEKENVVPQLPCAAKHSDPLEKQKQGMKGKEEHNRREQEDKEDQERQQREEELTKEKERHLEKQRELMRRLAEEEQRRLAGEKRIAEEQRQLQLEAERHREEERRRQEEERLRVEAEAKARAENEERQTKLNAFLASAGFKAVNEQKKTTGIVTSGFTYPLHEAVKANNLEAVQLLIWAGADDAQKNSKNLTPAALAKKLNKRDSHKAIVAALGE